MKYVLELNTDDAWAPFRKDIASMLIGCADLMGEAGLNLDPIIDAGVPIKGEVFMEQSGGQWQKMSSFTVLNLMPYDGNDEPFVFPPGIATCASWIGHRRKARGNRSDQRYAFPITERASICNLDPSPF